MKSNENYKQKLLDEINAWYEGADLNNPDYDDTINYADQNEMWLDYYGDMMGMGRDAVYDAHDKYLTDRGVDLNQVKWHMPAHKIKAMFTK